MNIMTLLISNINRLKIHQGDVTFLNPVCKIMII